MYAGNKTENMNRKNPTYGRDWISRLMRIVPPLQRREKRRRKKSPLTGYLSPVSCYLSPVTCHLSPVTCHLSPFTCHLSPVTCNLSPVTCQVSHVMCHLSHVTCHMSLQEQPQQQTLPFVTPPQCTVVGPRIPKSLFFKQKKSLKTQKP